MELPLSYHDLGFINDIVSSTSDSVDELDLYSIVLLNQEVSNDEEFIKFWNNAYVRILADGSGNRYISLYKRYKDRLALPHVLIGDLDSIESAAMEELALLGVKIFKIDDQMTTDFQKCLSLLKTHQQDLSILTNTLQNPNSSIIYTEYDDIRFLENSIKSPTPSSTSLTLAFGAFGGRFDQIIGNLNCLYTYQDVGFRVVLFGEGNNAAELCSGTTVINLSGKKWTNCIRDQSHCGYYPLKGTSNVVTAGFEWNLGNTEELIEVVMDAHINKRDTITLLNPDAYPTEFGGLVSTSNVVSTEKLRMHPINISSVDYDKPQIEQQCIIISTDRPVIFSCSFN